MLLQVFSLSFFTLPLQPTDGLRAVLLRNRERKTAVLYPIWKTEQVCRQGPEPHVPIFMLKTLLRSTMNGPKLKKLNVFKWKRVLYSAVVLSQGALVSYLADVCVCVCV